MLRIMLKIIIITVILLVSVTSAQAEVKIIPRSTDCWTCVDFSIDFAEKNHDWGVVTIGTDPTFQGSGEGYASHMVNYKLSSDANKLQIYDGLYDLSYTLYDWQNDERYYHFWINQKPVRTYWFLNDNREEFLNSTINS